LGKFIKTYLAAVTNGKAKDPIKVLDRAMDKVRALDCV
jgi:hypothetical protein